MTRATLFGALLLVGAPALDAQPRRVIDVRAAPVADTFEARFGELRQAEQAKDSSQAELALREIRRLRVERNVRQLEVVALPFVASGLARLRAGERERAERDFRDAIALAPDLPDAWFGLARAQAAGGVLGFLPALRSRTLGLWAFLGSWRGADALFLLAVPWVLMSLQALALAFALGLLLRHGGLLRHDIEERLGGARARAAAAGAATALLLLPALLFQGWGFLPLWCLALLFAYMTTLERSLAGALLVAHVACGPALELLARRPDDPVALVNLGNIEFAARSYPAAIARYKAVAEGKAPAEVVASARYNLSLAYLQVFDRQNSEESRAHADRLAGPLVARYEAAWRAPDGTYAVVDVGPSLDQVRAKFGTESQPVRPNLFGQSPSGLSFEPLARGLLSRFSASALVLAGVVLLVRWRRGNRMFTLRCLKCGTPFCRACHLGKVVGGLCTQCYHLFVVRDGVSGPARNRKLLEVQQEEGRRERVFRALSLVSPGAGHVYARRTWVGAGLALAWYGLLLLAALAGRVIPLTQAPESLVGRTHLVLTAVVLACVYVIANRLRPDFEAAHLARAPRRGRV